MLLCMSDNEWERVAITCVRMRGSAAAAYPHICAVYCCSEHMGDSVTSLYLGETCSISVPVFESEWCWCYASECICNKEFMYIKSSLSPFPNM